MLPQNLGEQYVRIQQKSARHTWFRQYPAYGNEHGDGTE